MASTPSRSRHRLLKVAGISLLVAAAALVPVGFFTGDPGFFLQRFFGLKADD